MWTDRRIVLAGIAPSPARLEAAAYDPRKPGWKRLDPPIPRAHPPAEVTMVATQGSVLLWSVWARITRRPGYVYGTSGVDVFRSCPARTLLTSSTLALALVPS